MSARRKRRRERQRRHGEAKSQRSSAPPGELREVGDVERLAYSRKQAAEALGVSISTIDRRVVPTVSTVKTPWGQRLIPVAGSSDSFAIISSRHMLGRIDAPPVGR